ncbi:MAG: hypothetical protein V7642_4870, partial [Burkholderiales bacterium]
MSDMTASLFDPPIEASQESDLKTQE